MKLALVFAIERAIQLSCDGTHRGFEPFETKTKIVSCSNDDKSMEEAIGRATREVECEYSQKHAESSMASVRAIGVEDEIPAVWHYKVNLEKITTIV